MPTPSNKTPAAPTEPPPPIPPAIVAAQLERLLALCAALLIGAGLIFWVAANWPEMSRQFKYHLLQAAVLLPALAALWPKLRQSTLLLATLALGGLLAFVGQTYQTGADTWQLFAAWAALSVPWAIGARSDMLWALWILIAGAGIGLWSNGHLSPAVPSFSSQRAIWLDSLIWLPLAALPAALAHFRLTGTPESPGSATVSRRLAAFLAVGAWSAYALLALSPFNTETDSAALRYLFNTALILLAGGIAWIARPRDFVTLAGVTLALNVVFLGLIAKGLFDSPFRSGNLIGSLLLFALIAAASVGGCSVWLYRAQQRAVGEKS